MTDEVKTLCLKCGECRTYTYKRTTRKNNLIQFQYCKGNHELIKQHTYTISRTYNRNNILISSGKNQSQLITKYMKKNPKNDMKFLNNDRTDLTLRNLQERARSCTIQEQEGETSIYPGVTKLKDGRYDSLIKIGEKSVFLGRYEKELDAYHHYLLKCEEIGRRINKTTRAYKTYQKQYDKNKYKQYKLKKKNKHKNISYDKSTGYYRLMITRKGVRVINEHFKTLDKAVMMKKRFLDEEKSKELDAIEFKKILQEKQYERYKGRSSKEKMEQIN